MPTRCWSLTTDAVRFRGSCIELVGHELLIADNPRIVPWLDLVSRASTHVGLGPVVMDDMEPPLHHHTQVVHLTAVPADHRLDALGPTPTWLRGHPSDLRAAQVDDLDPGLVRCPSLVSRIESLRVQAPHFAALPTTLSDCPLDVERKPDRSSRRSGKRHTDIRVPHPNTPSCRVVDRRRVVTGDPDRSLRARPAVGGHAWRLVSSWRGPACGQPRSPPGLGGDAVPGPRQRVQDLGGREVDRGLVPVRAHPQQHTVLGQHTRYFHREQEHVDQRHHGRRPQTDDTCLVLQGRPFGQGSCHLVAASGIDAR